MQHHQDKKKLEDSHSLLLSIYLFIYINFFKSLHTAILFPPLILFHFVFEEYSSV